jgi:hypothetical protein
MTVSVLMQVHDVFRGEILAGDAGKTSAFLRLGEMRTSRAGWLRSIGWPTARPLRAILHVRC